MTAKKSKPSTDPAAPQRVALYRRVSSRIQADRDLSLPEQAAQQRMYCTERGWIITHEFEDSAISGRSADNRPGFQDAVTAARAGSYDVLLVHKSDRAFRNQLDFLTYRALFAKHGVILRSVTEPFVGEADPTNQLIEGIMACFSEFYSRQLSAELRKGFASMARNKGRQHGQPPYGYRWTDLSRPGAHWETDPVEAEWVRWIYARYQEGRTAAEIAADLNRMGVPPPGTTSRTHHSRPSVNGWYSETILRILARRQYIGEACFDGEWFPAIHEALVSRETWEHVQVIRAGRGTGRADESRGLFSGGIAFCPLCRDAGRSTVMYAKPWDNHRKSPRSHTYYCRLRSIVRQRRNAGQPPLAESCPGYQIPERVLLGLVIDYFEQCCSAVPEQRRRAWERESWRPPVVHDEARAAEAQVQLIAGELETLPRLRAGYRAQNAAGLLSMPELAETLAAIDGREAALTAALKTATKSRDAKAVLEPRDAVSLLQMLRDEAIPEIVKRDHLKLIISAIVPAVDRSGVSVYVK